MKNVTVVAQFIVFVFLTVPPATSASRGAGRRSGSTKVERGNPCSGFGHVMNELLRSLYNHDLRQYHRRLID